MTPFERIVFILAPSQVDVRKHRHQVYAGAKPPHILDVCNFPIMAD
jgi:hypothetical protein